MRRMCIKKKERMRHHKFTKLMIEEDMNFFFVSLKLLILSHYGRNITKKFEFECFEVANWTIDTINQISNFLSPKANIYCFRNCGDHQLILHSFTNHNLLASPTLKCENDRKLSPDDQRATICPSPDASLILLI